jgi:hypothetical protein
VDNCGNAALNQIQTITVSDNTAPTFTMPVTSPFSRMLIVITMPAQPFTGDVSNEADNCSTGINATFNDVTVDGHVKEVM